MASVFFNNAVSANWDDADNWWTDTGFSSPYGSIPINDDVVTISSGNLDNGPSAFVNLAHLYVDGPRTLTFGSNIMVAGTLSLSVGSAFISGSVTCGTLSCAGTIGGSASVNCTNATLLSDCLIEGMIITGNLRVEGGAFTASNLSCTDAVFVMQAAKDKLQESVTATNDPTIEGAAGGGGGGGPLGGPDLGA